MLGYLFQLSYIETQSPQSANRKSHLTPLTGNMLIYTLFYLVHCESSTAIVATDVVMVVVAVAAVVFAIVVSTCYIRGP